jgi:AcrR family transcriptional regulator
MVTGVDTKSSILEAAVRSARNGLHCVTLRGVARVVGVDHRTVVWYFTDIAGLRDAVAADAIARDDTAVIARLVMDGHSSVAGWSAAKRRRYLSAAGSFS